MKNWNELRPLLREKFGRDFYFYNDAYKVIEELR